jgi:Relaxase/Mobilisation nuclease domain
MIIRIQANGGSFRGAGLYYLHDKSADQSLDKHLKPKTDERVWFSDTRNCLELDPDRALEEMWRTAEDQAYLKLQAGVKRGGRVCEDSVKTLSMSWHKDDRPDVQHMVDSADALLKHMGWDQHQAVYVGHNDTEHRHIHVILNRVNPENGRTLDDFREQRRAQEWALQYERAQDLVRCKQREINATKQAEQTSQRQQETTNTQERMPERAPAATVEQAQKEVPAPSIGRAANDHLPHNVIMLARPHEQQFNADEKLRQEHDATTRAEQVAEQRAELKDHQRAEREAFFKDGAKLFKATRHAVYDEVRQEYKAEWRQFYKDSEAKQKSAEASSETAMGRAFHFAKDGQWDAARDAFKDRDSVRDAVTKELAERKADLKSRQTEDLRERQRDACDALRDVRDVQYQDLLQRQRDERAAFKAGATLDTLGIGNERHDDDAIKPWPEKAANENRAADMAPPQQQQTASAVHNARTEAGPDQRQRDNVVAAVAQSIEPAVRAEEGSSIDLSDVSVFQQESKAPSRGVSDLAAGGIGAVADYLADQLSELFAPTPPEVREAQAKAVAKAEATREAERPAPEDKAAAYARIIDSAVLAVEEERIQQGEAWWKERDKGKGFERDQ